MNPGSAGSQGITILPQRFNIGSPVPVSPVSPTLVVTDEFMPQSVTKRASGDDEEAITPKAKAKVESKPPRFINSKHSS